MKNSRGLYGTAEAVPLQNKKGRGLFAALDDIVVTTRKDAS
jgi:hypothetical protein